MKILIIILSGVLSSLYSSSQNLNYKWTEEIRCTGKIASVAIITDVNKNIYTAGYFNDTADFDTGPGIALQITPPLCLFAYVEKNDPNGNYTWVKVFKGSSQSYSQATHMAMDPSGNLLITGVFGGTIDFDPGPGILNKTSIGGSEVFILKLDVAGNLLWVKSLPGLSAQHGASIDFDTSGNIYLGGNFIYTVDFDPGVGVVNISSVSNSYMDAYILKLDANANYLWVKTINGALDDFCYGIQVDNSGNVYATGSFRDVVDFDPGPGVINLSASSFYYYDVFFVKLNATGDFVWAKNIGSIGDDFGIALEMDSANNLYAIGSYTGVIDLDPGISVFSINSGSAFILKLDSASNFLWGKGIDAGPVAIALDGLANVYTTGTFNGTKDFDPGVAIANFTSYSTQDMFVLKLDAMGNYNWAVDVGHPLGIVACQAITIDLKNNICTTGKYSGTEDFDFGATVDLFTANANVFVHKFSQDEAVSLSDDWGAQNAITIFPNPTSDFLYVNHLNQFDLRLTNMLGQIVYRNKSPLIEKSAIDISQFKSGTYFLILENAHSKITKRIVKL